MASSKNKSPKKAPNERKPTPIAIPTRPIPDFDSTLFVQSVAAVDPQAKAIVKQLTGLIKGLEEVSSRDPSEALAHSERSLSLARTLAGFLRDIPTLVTDCTKLQQSVEGWRSSERRTRRGRLEAIAKELQWRMVGSWPEPVVNGIVFVAVDEKKDIATVNGRPLPGPVTAERLASVIAAELDALQSSMTKPAEFIDQLWKAYESAGGKPGTGIDVYDLIGAMTWQLQSKAFRKDPRAELYRGYSLAQFRADLTNYLGNAAPTVKENGKTFELRIVGGSYAQDGVFMYFPQTDRLATCGRLTFQPLETDQGK